MQGPLGSQDRNASDKWHQKMMDSHRFVFQKGPCAEIAVIHEEDQK